MLARVADTFVRVAPEVVDAVIAYPDGATDTLTGTPNHPFWVDAVRDYVPLGELEVGTVLHVQGGGEAILVSKTWRQGDFEVFDFEVEGLHNFYVRGEGSDAAGVLVHNSTFKGGKHGQTKLPVGDGLDSHHMPSDKASPLSRNEGPAIQMDPADHRQTASYGNPDYVAQQKAMIDEGGMKGFEDAFLMDVDDVQSKFGSKYDDAILEAIDALPDSLD